MKRTPILLCAPMFVVLSVSLGCDAPVPRAEAPPVVDGPPLAQGPPQQLNALRPAHAYSGIVATVDPNGLELAVGWEMANKTWRWNPDRMRDPRKRSGSSMRIARPTTKACLPRMS